MSVLRLLSVTPSASAGGLEGRSLRRLGSGPSRPAVWSLVLAAALFAGCKKKGSSGGGDGGTGTGSAGSGAQGPGGEGGQGEGTGGEESKGSGGGSPEPSGRVPGTSGYDCEPAQGTVPPLALSRIARGYVDPVLVSHPPNDERLFVVERDGAIKIVVDAGTSNTFLDLAERVWSPADGSFGEQGLLGLAFHPQYEENGLFYVHYSSAASVGDTVIARFRVTSDPDVADPDSSEIVLTVDQPADNHNGGTIAFGADGYLYIGLGDGGGGNDRFANGQNPSTLLGGISRIDPEKSGDSRIPSGNLRDTVPGAAPELWAQGLRNPYRFNFDACLGDLYIGDVGQDAWEEVSVAEFGQTGLNFGWPVFEGKQCRPPTTDCEGSGMTPPSFDYAHPEGDNPRSVVGGAVYRGSAIPGLRGQYLFADSYSRQVWRARYNPDRARFSDVTEIPGLIPSSVQLVSAIQSGSDGELYFVDMLAGEIYRLQAQ